MNALSTVTFYGHDLIILERDGNPHVAMKSVSEAIGLDWDAQRKRIQRHPVLNSTTVMMTAVAQDGK